MRPSIVCFPPVPVYSMPPCAEAEPPQIKQNVAAIRRARGCGPILAARSRFKLSNILNPAFRKACWEKPKKPAGEKPPGKRNGEGREKYLFSPLPAVSFARSWLRGLGAERQLV